MFVHVDRMLAIRGEGSSTLKERDRENSGGRGGWGDVRETFAWNEWGCVLNITCWHNPNIVNRAQFISTSSYTKEIRLDRYMYYEKIFFAAVSFFMCLMMLWIKNALPLAYLRTMENITDKKREWHRIYKLSVGESYIRIWVKAWCQAHLVMDKNVLTRTCRVGMKECIFQRKRNENNIKSHTT